MKMFKEMSGYAMFGIREPSDALLEKGGLRSRPKGKPH